MCAKTESSTMYYLSRFKKLGYVFHRLISHNSSNRCGGINHSRFVVRDRCCLIQGNFHYTLNRDTIMLSPSRGLTPLFIVMLEGLGNLFLVSCTYVYSVNILGNVVLGEIMFIYRFCDHITLVL